MNEPGFLIPDKNGAESVIPAGNSPEIFVVPEDLDGERFDAVIAALSEGHSRSYLKTLIKDGSVLLNEKEAKPSARVQEGDTISLILPEKIIPDIRPENIPLDILYEDDDILVVNKPK